MTEAVSDLHELLYISRLTLKSPFAIVGQIARQAREVNAKVGITGLLVFDGGKFCQLLEGQYGIVRAVFERIKVDPRHLLVKRLHEGSVGKRRFPRFSMGYAEFADSDMIETLGANVGLNAISAFAEMLPRFDVEP